MTNLQESVYVIAALSTLAALLMAVSGRRRSAIRFAILAAVCVVVAVGLYFRVWPGA